MQASRATMRPAGRFAVQSMVLAACVLAGAAPMLGAERPNVLLIVADNLGYGDVGCYGCRDIPTPTLDRLAQQGVRFTNYYSNGPECTPTRTALLTGRYQQRVGGMECAIGSGNVGRYDDAVRLAERHQLGLPASEPTLSKLLKQAGYRTAGFGKWHLGYEKQFLPPNHGFDHFLAALGGTMDYFYHNEPDGTPALVEDDRPVVREGYFTDMVTDRAVEFLREKSPSPFFLYLPYTAPSAPFQDPDHKPAEPKVSHAWDSTEWQQGTRDVLRKIIRRLDQGIGRVLATLDESGQADRTLVIFFSDNGAYRIAASNGPYRGYAAELFDGGIHVPCIVRWPGRLPAGKVEDRMAVTFDLSASILEAAGVQTPAGHKLDGIPILEQLASGKPPVARPMFWRYRRADRTWRAVRDGDLKYVSLQDGPALEEYLFDVAADPGETRNLIAARPEDAARLKRLLDAWQAEVVAARN